MAQCPWRSKIQFIDRVDSLSYSVILGLWTINIFLFAAMYLLVARIPGNAPVSGYDLHPVQDVWSVVYFSVITATGTGYGDIVPIGYSRILAAIESFSGLILLAVFVTKLL